MKIERKAVLSFSEEEYDAVRTVIQVLNSYKDTPGGLFSSPQRGWMDFQSHLRNWSYFRLPRQSEYQKSFRLVEDIFYNLALYQIRFKVFEDWEECLNYLTDLTEDPYVLLPLEEPWMGFE